MCFSAGASFGASVVLSVIGVADETRNCKDEKANCNSALHVIIF
jgi:hypothetical protein